MLVDEIKKKPELSGLSDVFVQEAVDKYLRGRKLNVYSKKDAKIIVKQVRSELRKYTGRFSSSKLMLLQDSNVKKLLEGHQSTKERLPYYSNFKKKIYNLKPKSILDIGCGLNPLALAKKDIKYFACDIDENCLKIVSKFFKENKIEGEVFFLDAIKSTNFPNADIVLLLKILDLVDKNGHKRAEQILKQLDCKTIIASFSTKTLSGRAMNHPQRGWIERLCMRLNITFEIWKTPNEIYYFMKKN